MNLRPHKPYERQAEKPTEKWIIKVVNTLPAAKGTAFFMFTSHLLLCMSHSGTPLHSNFFLYYFSTKNIQPKLY